MSVVGFAVLGFLSLFASVAESQGGSSDVTAPPRPSPLADPRGVSISSPSYPHVRHPPLVPASPGGLKATRARISPSVSPSGARLVVDFVGATNRGSDVSGVDVPCEELFALESIALFGDHPRCSWVSSSQIGVALGRGSRLQPGDFVTLPPSSSLRETTGDGSNIDGLVGARLRVVSPPHPATPRISISTSASLGVNVERSKPVAKIVGPSQRQWTVFRSRARSDHDGAVGVLDAGGSFDVDSKDSSLGYQWSCVSDGSSECDSPLIELLARQSASNAKTVKIPAAAVTAGRSYMFHLSVVTSDGILSEMPAVAIVDVVEEDILEVSINGATTLSVDSPLRLEGYASFKSHHRRGHSLSGTNLEYSWSEASGAFDFQSRFVRTAQNHRNLVIDAGALRCCRVYNLTLHAKSKDLGVVGASSMLVRVQRGPLIYSFNASRDSSISDGALPAMYRLTLDAHSEVSPSSSLLYKFLAVDESSGKRFFYAGYSPSSSIKAALPSNRTFNVTVFVKDRMSGVSKRTLTLRTDPHPPAAKECAASSSAASSMIDNMRATSSGGVFTVLTFVQSAIVGEAEATGNSVCPDGAPGLLPKLLDVLTSLCARGSMLTIHAQQLALTLEHLSNRSLPLDADVVAKVVDLSSVVLELTTEIAAAPSSDELDQVNQIVSSIYRALSNALRSGKGSCRTLDEGYDLLRAFLSMRADTFLSGERASHFVEDGVVAGVVQMDLSDRGIPLNNSGMSILQFNARVSIPHPAAAVELEELDHNAAVGPEFTHAPTSLLVFSVDSSPPSAGAGGVGVGARAGAGGCFNRKGVAPVGPVTIIEAGKKVESVEFDLMFPAGLHGTDSVGDFKCSFLNETTNEWDQAGCTTLGVTSGHVTGGKYSRLHCRCNHLTTFAVIRAERLSQAGILAAQPLDPQSVAMLAVLFFVVAVVSTLQISKHRTLSPGTPYSRGTSAAFFMTSSILSVAICLTQIAWLVLLASHGSVIALAIFASAARAFVYCLFTSTVASWAAVAYSVVGATPKKLVILKFTLYSALALMCVLIVALAVAMSVAPDDDLDVLSRTGTTLLCAMNLATSVAFVTMGAFLHMRFARLLKNATRRQQQRKSIWLIPFTWFSISFSLSFMAQTAILSVDVFNPALFARYLDWFQIAYSALVILSLSLVAYLSNSHLVVLERSRFSKSKSASQRHGDLTRHRLKSRNIASSLNHDFNNMSSLSSPRHMHSPSSIDADTHTPVLASPLAANAAKNQIGILSEEATLTHDGGHSHAHSITPDLTLRSSYPLSSFTQEHNTITFARKHQHQHHRSSPEYASHSTFSTPQFTPEQPMTLAGEMASFTPDFDYSTLTVERTVSSWAARSTPSGGGGGVLSRENAASQSSPTNVPTRGPSRTMDKFQRMPPPQQSGGAKSPVHRPRSRTPPAFMYRTVRVSRLEREDSLYSPTPSARHMRSLSPSPIPTQITPSPARRSVEVGNVDSDSGMTSYLRKRGRSPLRRAWTTPVVSRKKRRAVRVRSWSVDNCSAPPQPFPVAKSLQTGSVDGAQLQDDDRDGFIPSTLSGSAGMHSSEVPNIQTLRFAGNGRPFSHRLESNEKNDFGFSGAQTVKLNLESNGRSDFGFSGAQTVKLSSHARTSSGAFPSIHSLSPRARSFNRDAPSTMDSLGTQSLRMSAFSPSSSSGESSANVAAQAEQFESSSGQGQPLPSNYHTVGVLRQAMNAATRLPRARHKRSFSLQVPAYSSPTARLSSQSQIQNLRKPVAYSTVGRPRRETNDLKRQQATTRHLFSQSDERDRTKKRSDGPAARRSRTTDNTPAQSRSPSPLPPTAVALPLSIVLPKRERERDEKLPHLRQKPIVLSDFALMNATLSQRDPHGHSRLSSPELAKPLARRSKTPIEMPTQASRIRFPSADAASANSSLPFSKSKPTCNDVMTATEYIDSAGMTAAEYIENFSCFEVDSSDDDNDVPANVDKNAKGKATTSKFSKSSKKFQGRPSSKSVGHNDSPKAKPPPRLSAAEFGSPPPLALFSSGGSHKFLLGSAPTRLSDNYVEVAQHEELMRNGGGFGAGGVGGGFGSSLTYTFTNRRVVRDTDRHNVSSVEPKSKASSRAPRMTRARSRSAVTSPFDQLQTHRRARSRAEGDRGGGASTPKAAADLSAAIGVGIAQFCPAAKRLRNNAPPPEAVAFDVKKLARMLDNRHPRGMSGRARGNSKR